MKKVISSPAFTILVILTANTADDRCCNGCKLNSVYHYYLGSKKWSTLSYYIGSKRINSSYQPSVYTYSPEGGVVWNFLACPAQFSDVCSHCPLYTYDVLPLGSSIQEAYRAVLSLMCFFFTFLFQFGCFKDDIKPVLDDLRSGFCANMYAEARYIAHEGYPAQDQDLFMELRKCILLYEI